MLIFNCYCIRMSTFVAKTVEFVTLLNTSNRSFPRVQDIIASGYENRFELKRVLNLHSNKWSPTVKRDFIAYCIDQPDALYAVQYAVQLWSITQDPREVNDILKQYSITSLSPADEYAHDALSCMYMYNEFVAEVNYLIDATLTSEQKLCVVIEKHAEYSTRNNTTEKEFNTYVQMKSFTTFRRYFNMLDNYVYQTVQNLYPSVESECYLYWHLLRNKWSPYIPIYNHCAPTISDGRKEVDHYNSGYAPIIFCERRVYLHALKELLTNVKNNTTIVTMEKSQWNKYETMSRLEYLRRGIRLLNERLINEFPLRLVEAARAVYDVHALVDDVQVDNFSKVNGISRDSASELLFTMSNVIMFERQIVLLTA